MTTKDHFTRTADFDSNRAYDAHQVLTQVAQFTRRELQQMLDSLFADCQSPRLSTQFGDISPHLNQLIAQARNKIEQQFYQDLDESFHSLDVLIDAAPTASIGLDTPFMADDEPDLSDCIDAIVIKANHHYKGILTQIQDRVNQFIIPDSLNVDALPISPVRLLSIYQHSVATVPFDKNARRILYQLFEAKVLDHCNQLYQGLVELLAQAVPKGPGAGRSDPLQTQLVQSSLPSTHGPNTASTDPFASPFSGSSTGFISPFTSHDLSLSPFTAASPFGSHHYASSEHPSAHAGVTVQQQNGAQQFHQEKRKFEKTGIDHRGEEPIFTHTQGEEMQSQAKQAQAYTQISDGVEEHVVETREVIRQERVIRRQQTKGISIEQIRRDTPSPTLTSANTYDSDITPEPRQLAQQQSAPHAGPADLSEITEIVSMVFEFILDDSHIASELRTSIGRLQMPMVRLAAVDRTLFTRRTHPARKLLNELAQQCAQCVDHEYEQKLIAEIKSLVEDVLDNFAVQSDVFETARTRLQQFSAQAAPTPISGANLDANPSEEGRVQHPPHPDALINSEIDSLLQKFVLPACVRELIVGSWSQVLTLLLGQHGREDQMYQDALGQMHQLAQWMQFNSDEVNTGPTAAQFEQLLETLGAGLEKIGFTTLTIDKQLGVLEEEYERRFGLPEMELQRGLNPHMPIVDQNSQTPETCPNDDGPDSLTCTNLNSDSEAVHELPSVPVLLPVEDNLNLDAVETSEAPCKANLVAEDPTAKDTADAWIPSFNAEEFAEEDLVEVEVAEVAYYEQDPAPSTTDTKRDKFDKMVDHLKLGATLELTDGYGYSFRGNLAEIDDKAQKLHFIDKAGHRIAARTFKGLAMELRNGQAQIYTKESLLSAVFGGRKH